MTDIRVPAIICGVRAHGEHGAIVRALTAEHGLLAGYVSGARSRALRAVLMPGNDVAITLRQMGTPRLQTMTAEPLHSRAALMTEPLPAAAIDWVTALSAVALPENHPYPAIHAALDAILVAVESAAVARDWASAIVQYEALILAELGYGAPITASGLFAALAQTRGRLDAKLLPGKRGDILAARDRLTDRLRAAILPAG